MKKNRHYHSIILFSIALLNFTNSSALELLQPIQPNSKATSYEGSVVSPKGAWCWFADPRSLHYENAAGTINNTYIGYIDVHGNIKATQHNFVTGKNNEVLIRSYFQPDDHDNPTFLVLPDQRIMIFYSRHTDEACFYYRVSKKPGDITSLGEEIKIVTSHNTTYPSPFILSDEPNSIYLCWRGINWHPTIAKLSIPDAQDKVNITWGPYQIVQSTGARPYAKYTSNGKDKIFMTYTTGHPDNENPNYVYFNYVDIKTLQLKDIKGKVLSTIASGTHNVNATSSYTNSNPDAVVDNTTMRNWVWQTAIDKDGNPVVAIVRISADKNTHHYYYAKWTGSEWRKTFLANGGTKFHQTAGLELCYSGGMAIDDSNPDIVYCSVPTAGTSGNVYEIFKYEMAADGTVSSSSAITTNSKLNNSRPYIIQNSGNSALKLAWMHGNYYDWIVSSTRPQGYPTAIHCDFDLPKDNIDLNNGLVVNEDFNGTVTGTARTSGGVLIAGKQTTATLTAQQSQNFSISLTPYIYDGSYEGTLLNMGNISYGLNAGTLKPYIKIGESTYNSTNVLGTSDVWQTQARGTGGIWYTPTKLKYFNLTITYENETLRIYRNGLIDQSIDVSGLSLSDLNIGGFLGWVEDCRIYNRALSQGEVKKLTETSLAYTFDNNLLSDIEMESLTVPSNIYSDVVLPTKTSSGISVTWSSDKTNIVSNTGLITFPTTETEVKLTATVNSKTKVFNTIVYPRNINNNKVLIYNFNSSDVFTSNNTKYVQDKSGNENHAKIMGNAQITGTLDLSANTAAGFSTNGYAMAPNGITDNLRSCTFLFKIKPGSLTGSPRIFDFGSASSNSFFLRASVFTAGYKYNGGSTILINASSTLTVGQESKVAMTFDARTKTTKVYLNGSETLSSTAITYEPYQLSTIGATTRNYIGRTQWWDSSVASSNIDFNGTIDDFMIYDIALSSAEIGTLQSTNTSVDQINNVALSVFPNPAKGGSEVRIDVNSGQKISRYEIINQLGQIVAGSAITNNAISFISPDHKGVYLVRLFTHENMCIAKKLFID